MNNLKISVVIPTLNEEKYLEKTLLSFKNQTFRDFELVISDGGSTDRTVSIAQKYTKKIVVAHNTNVCQARDRGLKEASGEILVGADADTYYPPNHLKSIADEFGKAENVVAVTGRAKFVDGPRWCTVFLKIFYSFAYFIYKISGFVLYSPAFNLSYRKDIFLKIGGYNTNLDFGGDELDVLRRLKKEGKVVLSANLMPQTSGRRFTVGIFTFLLKHVFYYYWLNYLFGRIFNRPLTKAKPVR